MEPKTRKVKINGVWQKTPEYRVWAHIKDRCGNTRDKRYPGYGGRGIRVCDRWLKSFDNFLEDMGKRPSPEHSIDRINNDGDYTPENCRWATRSQQIANTRTRKDNTSGIRGVKWFAANESYMADISHNRKRYFLGYFKDKEQAAIARECAMVQLLGKEARTEYI